MSQQNLLVNVSAFVEKSSIPQLHNELLMPRLMDGEYKGWEQARERGVEGATFRFGLPHLSTVENTFGFGPGTTGGYRQRDIGISAGIIRSSKFALDVATRATYNLSNGIKDQIKANMLAIATDMDSNIINGFTFTPAVGSPYFQYGMATGSHRFAGTSLELTLNGGQPIATNTNADILSLVRSLHQAISFGASTEMCCVLPPMAMAQITGTQQNLFTPITNDEVSKNWRLQGGFKFMPDTRVTFYPSNLINPHISGTLADAQTAGFEIVSIVDTDFFDPQTQQNVLGSQIAISPGAPKDGQTIKQGDMLDIIASPGQPPVELLKRVNVGGPALFNPQGLVTSSQTVAGGNILIDIVPRLKFTIPLESDSNISRAINVTPGQADQVRFLKSHIPAFVFVKGYGKFVAPPLLKPIQIPSITKTTMSGVNIRFNTATILDTLNDAFGLDVLYGFTPVGEGITRIPFSLKMGGAP